VLLNRFAAGHGLPDPHPAVALQAAEAMSASGQYGKALVLARLAAGLATHRDESIEREHAESVTDRLLAGGPIRMSGSDFSLP
jgi:hypothetical protein